MGENLIISATQAVPLGDLRNCDPGTLVWVHLDAPKRPDWGYYLDALQAAIAHGASVVWQA